MEEKTGWRSRDQAAILQQRLLKAFSRGTCTSRLPMISLEAAVGISQNNWFQLLTWPAGGDGSDHPQGQSQETIGSRLIVQDFPSAAPMLKELRSNFGPLLMFSCRQYFLCLRTSAAAKYKQE
ncbi:uncharacterized protein LOC143839614 [Paroedura picta]|uniref:uncharacterized protein LOC143839614 n=1 Tax=Paroedura picta TaxID=143630 RepID=UPI0040578005